MNMSNLVCRQPCRNVRNQPNSLGQTLGAPVSCPTKDNDDLSWPDGGLCNENVKKIRRFKPLQAQSQDVPSPLAEAKGKYEKTCSDTSLISTCPSCLGLAQKIRNHNILSLDDKLLQSCLILGLDADPAFDSLDLNAE